MTKEAIPQETGPLPVDTSAIKESVSEAGSNPAIGSPDEVCADTGVNKDTRNSTEFISPHELKPQAGDIPAAKEIISEVGLMHAIDTPEVYLAGHFPLIRIGPRPGSGQRGPTALLKEIGNIRRAAIALLRTLANHLDRDHLAVANPVLFWHLRDRVSEEKGEVEKTGAWRKLPAQEAHRALRSGSSSDAVLRAVAGVQSLSGWCDLISKDPQWIHRTTYAGPDGSKWLLGNYLPLLFRKIFGREPSVSTSRDSKGGGPYGRFASGCCRYLGVKASLSSIKQHLSRQKAE